MIKTFPVPTGSLIKGEFFSEKGSFPYSTQYRHLNATVVCSGTILLLL